MRKKLLMNNYSENGLMPVMDGLVCWLDARFIENNILEDKSNNNNYMNIIGDYDNENNELDLLKKSWTKINAEHSINISTDFTIIFKVNIKSAPISSWGRLLTMSRTGSSNAEILVLNYCTSDTSLYVNNCRVIFPNVTPRVSGVYTYVIVNKDNKISLSVNDNSFGPANINQFSDLRFKEIGFNCENITHLQDVDMKLHSFKFYNRALTEEEIQQNYLYEQSIKRGEQ